MKVFITKYALTAGIEDVEVEQSIESPSMVFWAVGGWYNYAHGEGKNWHRTRESAVAMAKKMRLDKIASLKKSIKKLESLKFK